MFIMRRLDRLKIPNGGDMRVINVFNDTLNTIRCI